MNSVERKIIEVLERIRPFLNADGGDLEYIKYEDGVCYVRMLGACADCLGLDTTLKDGIEALLCEEIPEVIAVKNIE